MHCPIQVMIQYIVTFTELNSQQAKQIEHIGNLLANIILTCTVTAHYKYYHNSSERC